MHVKSVQDWNGSPLSAHSSFFSEGLQPHCIKAVLEMLGFPVEQTTFHQDCLLGLMWKGTKAFFSANIFSIPLENLHDLLSETSQLSTIKASTRNSPTQCCYCLFAK